MEKERRPPSLGMMEMLARRGELRQRESKYRGGREQVYDRRARVRRKNRRKRKLMARQFRGKKRARSR